jgi:hypothetical protein
MAVFVFSYAVLTITTKNYDNYLCKKWLGIWYFMVPGSYCCGIGGRSLRVA